MVDSQAGEHALLILPTREKQPRSVLERVATELREKGHEVTLLSAAEFGQPIQEETLATAMQPRLL